jgi:hypothetical protein
MPSDLEQPTNPQDYASGFFAADYRNEPAAGLTNWIDPGDRFFRVKFGLNADDSPATGAQITTAINQWEGFTQCIRWRIRLHHEALLRWKHQTLNIYVYYHSGIPKSKRNQIKACTDPGSFEYLGATFAVAKQKIEDRQVGLSLQFWPGKPPNIPAGAIDTVVQGWEGDFGI